MRGASLSAAMSSPFISEIRIMSFNFPPKGWAFCNGQLLPINQNQALFSLLGTTYGGDGRVNFALPNLQGSVPVHTGNGFTLGQKGGEVNHTLLVGEMPAHNHPVFGSSNNGDNVTPAGNVLGAVAGLYGPPSTPTAISPSTVSATGGSQPHTNLQPYLALAFCIALQGIFPSQN